MQGITRIDARPLLYYDEMSLTGRTFGWPSWPKVASTEGGTSAQEFPEPFCCLPLAIPHALVASPGRFSTFCGLFLAIHHALVASLGALVAPPDLSRPRSLRAGFSLTLPNYTGIIPRKKMALFSPFSTLFPLAGLAPPL